jgi:hypothetical protein
VKIYCINRATTYGFSIFEFEVYGTSASGRSSTKGTPVLGQYDAEHKDSDVLSAFPNPTGNRTTVTVNLPHAANAVLDVSNSMGKRISEIHNGYLEAGSHEFNVNSESWAPGFYLYTLKLDGQRITKKLIKR